jgi:Tfp pilus assembly protein PilE
MRSRRIEPRKVLTFVKLMVGVIIIVGIWAAIAVHFYTGYVERGRVTEATSIMGAIITSQKVERSRTGNFYSGSTIAEFKARGIDITDTEFFTYETVTTPDGGFTVTATTTDAFGATGEWVKYIYEPGEGGRWTTSDGDPMPHDDMYEPTPPSHSPPSFVT